MKYQISSSLSCFIGLSFCLVVSLSACSSVNGVNSISKKQKSDESVTSGLSKKTDKKLEHIHPSNPCTAAVSHSHVSESKDHKHSYDCENTNEYVSNAHVHPATKLNRRYRHVHPNGSNKHSHHR